MAIRAPDGAKNGLLLHTGQWYAPSAVINDALIQHILHILHIGVQKKLYKLSKLGGGGSGEVIWTKSKRTAPFFLITSLTYTYTIYTTHRNLI